MVRRSLFWALTCVSAFASCKVTKESGSSHKSLENFAAGRRLRDNQCGLDPATQNAAALSPSPLAKTIRIDPGTDLKGREASLKKVLLETLGAVPEKVQTIFADNLKGRIFLTSSIARHCGDLFGTPGEKTFLGLDNAVPPGCYRLEEAPGGSYRLNIYLQDDESAVRYAAVRLFGYVVGRVFPQLSPLPGGKFLLSDNLSRTDTEGLKKLIDFKNGLVRAFLYDLKQKNIFRLENMERFLGDGSAGALRANVTAMEKASDKDYDIWKNLSFKLRGDGASPTFEQRQYRQEFFTDFVFAEAFDSFYCNTWAAYDEAKVKKSIADRSEPLNEEELVSLIKLTGNTKLFMRDVFPATYKLFQPIDDFFMGKAFAGGTIDTKGTSFSLNLDFASLLSLLGGAGIMQYFSSLLANLNSGGGGGGGNVPSIPGGGGGGGGGGMPPSGPGGGGGGMPPNIPGGGGGSVPGGGGNAPSIPESDGGGNVADVDPAPITPDAGGGGGGGAPVTPPSGPPGGCVG